MYQAGLAWRYRVGVIACALYFVWLGGCGESPLSPTTKSTSESTVYFCNTTGNRMLYSYNPYSRHLDSAALNYTLTGYEYFRGVTVSADGSLLYMPIQTKSVVVVFDSDSLNVVTELPYKTGSPVAISPDGNLMAIFGKDLWVLNTDDYSVLFHDTSDIYNGVFSANSERLYAVALGSMPPEAQMLYVLDLSGSEPSAVTKVLSAGPIGKVVPTQDESKLLLYLYFGSFAIYDVATDSVLLSHSLPGAGGRIALTPDGKYAFYGSPGTILPPDPGTSAFAIIDIEQDQVEAVIDTRNVIDSLSPEYFEVGSLAVTPDGTFLVMLDAPSAHQLLLFDIGSRQFVDYINNTGNVQFSDMDVRAVSE